MEKLRLGLIGLNFGRHMVDDVMSKPDLPVRLVKICDLDQAKAREIAGKHNLAVSPSLDALAADPEIDAICLYTGPNGRADLIRSMIRSGKDVMTTKPFELDPAAALDVLNEAKTIGRVIHLNSPQPRPFGEMAVIRGWIDQGRIGRPTLAQASVWAYYGRTRADGSWYDDPLKCPLAPMFRLGIYPLNDLLTIFKNPVSVQVAHSRIETERPTPDNCSMTITFADGAIVTIVASFVVGTDFYKNTKTICGTQGVIYYGVGPRATPADPQPVTLSTPDGVETKQVTEYSGAYDWEFFARRIRREVPEDVTKPEDIVAAIRVVKAMSEAERTGSVVAICS